MTDDLMRGWIADGKERAHLARLKELETAEAGDGEAASEWRSLAHALETKALEIERWWRRRGRESEEEAAE